MPDNQTPPDGAAYFSAEALALTLTHSQPVESRERLVWIDPVWFLSVAMSGFDDGKAQAIQCVVDSGALFNTLPFLNFVHDGEGTARVVGHEGRHRARALIAKGIAQMPFMLRHVYDPNGQPMTWGAIENDPSRFRDEWPTRLFGEIGSDDATSRHRFNAIPFPVADLRLSLDAQQAFLDRARERLMMRSDPLAGFDCGNVDDDRRQLKNKKPLTQPLTKQQWAEMDDLLDQLGITENMATTGVRP